MVRNHARPRTRAGAAVLSVAMATGMVVGTSATAPTASAMVMRSDRPDAPAWVKKYNDRLVYIVNRQRARHGLRHVRKIDCADSWAKKWSDHLARADRFEHSNLGGLMSQCQANYASENLAMIYDGARPIDLVRAWLNSPGHRAIMLSNKAKRTGVSIRWDANQHAWVAVQNFVRR